MRPCDRWSKFKFGPKLAPILGDESRDFPGTLSSSSTAPQIFPKPSLSLVTMEARLSSARRLPPAKISKKRYNKISTTVATRAFQDKVELAAKESVFYDKDAPTVRARRERIRGEFEAFVKLYYGKEDEDDVWNVHTIIPWSEAFLTGIAQWSEGKLANKVKAGTLWQFKDSLYWWSVRYIKGFSTIYHEWHTRLSGYICYTACDEDLSVLLRPKNNLTETELALFFARVMELEKGVENWKQHYAALLMAWATGARPGSFTVGTGYHQVC
jgi:hypothetical protein